MTSSNVRPTVSVKPSTKSRTVEFADQPDEPDHQLSNMDDISEATDDNANEIMHRELRAAAKECCCRLSDSLHTTHLTSSATSQGLAHFIPMIVT